MTDEEKKEYFEMGYRKACLEHDIPYVRVRKEKYSKIIMVQTALSEAFLNSGVADFKDIIAEKVVRELEKAKG